MFLLVCWHEHVFAYFTKCSYNKNKMNIFFTSNEWTLKYTKSSYYIKFLKLLEFLKQNLLFLTVPSLFSYWASWWLDVEHFFSRLYYSIILFIAVHDKKYPNKICVFQIGFLNKEHAVLPISSVNDFVANFVPRRSHSYNWSCL